MFKSIATIAMFAAMIVALIAISFVLPENHVSRDPIGRINQTMPV